jgi:hypothetical protein
MPRTNKHQSKRKRNAALGLDKDGAEPVITAKGARLLTNALIQQGEGTLERGLHILQNIHDKLGDTKTIVACAHCAARIGIKRCARCPNASTIRYCSSECQLAAWPAHKAICGVTPCVD